MQEEDGLIAVEFALPSRRVAQGHGSGVRPELVLAIHVMRPRSNPTLSAERRRWQPLRLAKGDYTRTGLLSVSALCLRT